MNTRDDRKRYIFDRYEKWDLTHTYWSLRAAGNRCNGRENGSVKALSSVL